VAGPVSAAVYTEVLASGPCVYCGAEAECVDHVRPLARDGAEAADNLAPACQSCNASKRDRLLIEWIPERVASAAARSPIVAAELARQLGEIERES
jgi:5-methylcytosine-specific restriction endonuclease McrA